MAAVRAPFGFKPSRSRSGVFNPATRRYQQSAGGTRPIFPGDAVTLVSGLAVLVATTAQDVLGVVAQCLDSNQKPLVFSQPANGPILFATDAGFVDVYSDNNNIYWAATDVTANALSVGTWVQVSALSSTNANNRSGRCPVGIQVADTSVTASGTRHWKIVGPSPMQRDYLTQADWVEGVEVVWSNHGTPNV